jgi:hypothetical protein
MSRPFKIQSLAKHSENFIEVPKGYMQKQE